MTITEAAERLGLAPSTLRRQAQNGKLATHRMGGRIYVTEMSLEVYRRDRLGKRKPKDIVA